MASCTPHAQESQGILHHTVGFWPWPLLWLQICKYAKRQRAKGRKCRPKGQRHKGGCPSALYPTLLYTLSKSNRTHHGQWDGQRVTDLSPSAVRCHRRGLEHKIRYETCWWLGYLTISGLVPLTALQITSNFAGDCIRASNLEDFHSIHYLILTS